MTSPENFVRWPPTGFAIALQFYEQDEARAMRLARLLAALEEKPQDDVIFLLCPRWDTPQTDDAWDTKAVMMQKFQAAILQSDRIGTGHPHGANELWSGVMDKLHARWSSGNLFATSVFTIEADGVPLRRDWIARIRAEHAKTLAAGKLVTGHLMQHPIPHINGTLVAHLSIWGDRPTLRRTPSEQAWDLFHADVIAGAARDCSAIRNIYGARGYSDGVLDAMAKETAWLTSTKDDSALEWAERTLIER